MKKIFIIILSLFLSSTLMAAGSDSSSGSSSSMGDSLYEDAVKLVKRAGKLEKKDKTDKAKKLYAQAFNKLEKAYKSDKKIQIFLITWDLQLEKLEILKKPKSFI